MTDHADDNRPKSLGTYLETIAARPGECRIVKREADPANFQVTALLEQLDRRGEYPAVLFENTLDMYGNSSPFRVLANLWATRERCAEILGLDPSQNRQEIGLKFAEPEHDHVEPVVIDRSAAPVQQHVYQGDDADMWKLPAVRHYEMDLGPVFTMALVMHAPGQRFYNVTFVKTFPETPKRGGVTIHTADMSRMLREWRSRGERVPVINVLGHHPMFWFGSLAVTPYGNNEYSTIGAYLGEPLRLVPSVTWGEDFLVPADAEVIIEGEINADELTVVDPYGDITRLYQAQEFAPLMEVTAITHRDKPIVQDVFTGHREHFLLGLIAREGSVYSHLNQKVGNVTGVHLPYSGNGRTSCYISINKKTEGQPKLTAMSALAHVPGFQHVVIVDDDVDVFREDEVLWAVNTFVDPARDIDYLRNVGRATDRAMDNNRLLIDATRPSHVAYPTRARVPAKVMEAVNLDEWLGA